jgi:hypothetical protein
MVDSLINQHQKESMQYEEIRARLDEEEEKPLELD